MAKKALLHLGIKEAWLANTSLCPIPPSSTAAHSAHLCLSTLSSCRALAHGILPSWKGLFWAPFRQGPSHTTAAPSLEVLPDHLLYCCSLPLTSVTEAVWIFIVLSTTCLRPNMPHAIRLLTPQGQDLCVTSPYFRLVSSATRKDCLKGTLGQYVAKEKMLK